MNFSHKIEGDVLTITINVGKEAKANAVVSKSASLKALKAGLPEPAPSLIASTGGFVNLGVCKLSLNATL